MSRLSRPLIIKERVIKVKKPVNITRHLVSCRARVFLIMLMVALVALPAFAQEDLWEELNDKASQLLQERRYADAIKVSEEAIRVAADTFAPNHPCIAISKNLLGTLYWTYGRFDDDSGCIVCFAGICSGGFVGRIK